MIICNLSKKCTLTFLCPHKELHHEKESCAKMCLLFGKDAKCEMNLKEERKIKLQRIDENRR